MFGKRKFNNLFGEFDSMFNEFDSLFNNMKPTYYRVGPNGYVLYYGSETDKNTTDEITTLKDELEICVENQDFERAVELRDKIKSLEENGEKINKLRKDLKKSIDEQNFEESIKLRDKLNKLTK